LRPKASPRSALVPPQCAAAEARPRGNSRRAALQGRISREDLEELILLGHPSTYALFQFRYAEALSAPPRPAPAAILAAPPTRAHLRRTIYM
jgi:hypothetical protein